MRRGSVVAGTAGVTAPFGAGRLWQANLSYEAGALSAGATGASDGSSGRPGTK
jgi:hypothetical protein